MPNLEEYFEVRVKHLEQLAKVAKENGQSAIVTACFAKIDMIHELSGLVAAFATPEPEDGKLP